MQNVKDLATIIWGKDAPEVIAFLHEEDLSKKVSFRNEESLMNYVARILTRHCNRRIDKSNSLDFWEVRKKSIQIDVEPEYKSKNILYVIRLLTGKLQPYPEFPETEYDFSQEDLSDMAEESFWENSEKRRESWIY